VDENSRFMEFLRVLDASIGVQNTFFCLWTTVPLNCKICHFYSTYNLCIIYQTVQAWCLPQGLDMYVCMYVGKYVIFKFVYICRHCACHTVMSCVVIVWFAAA